MQHSDYAQNRQQAAILAAAMFGSIVAAVLVSTFIIMSLMRGEMASALSYAQPVAAQTASAGTCTSPADTSSVAAMPAGGSGEAPAHHEAWAVGGHGAAGAAGSATWAPAHHTPATPVAAVTNSYNSSHVSNNSVSNNSNVTTNITDSYNGQGNGNTTSTNTTVNTNVNTNLNSNNTDNSDNSTTTTTNASLNATDNSTNTDNSQVLSNNDVLSNNPVILPLVPVL